MLKVSIYITCCLMIISCTVPKQNLRDRYVRDNPGLEPDIKKAIKDADVIVGMTKEQVLASRATPIFKGKRKLDDKTVEYWTYPDLKGSPFADIYFSNNVVVKIEKTDKGPPVN